MRICLASTLLSLLSTLVAALPCAADGTEDPRWSGFHSYLAAGGVAAPMPADADPPTATERAMQKLRGIGTGVADCVRSPLAPCPVDSGVRPHGRRALTLALLVGATLAVEIAAEAPRDSRWTAVGSFDDDARDTLKAGSRSGRSDTKTASDVLLGLLPAALVGDWWLQRERYPIANSITTDMGWFLANEIATRTAKVSAGRERPYVEPCLTRSNYVSSCNDGRKDNESFYSGHASTTAVMAGLICARRLAPRDRRAADWAFCGGAATGAVATGLLRVAADRHYLTDVLAGWASGALFGYVLPRVFDYRDDEGAFSRMALRPLRERGAWGVEYSFRF